MSLTSLKTLVAFKAKGAVRLMLNAQAELEDIEGAIAAGQPEVAAIQARALVATCLSVRSLALGGEVDGAADGLAFDPFAGLPEAETAVALSLVAEALEPGTPAAAPAWLERLSALVAGTEASLGLAAALPLLRSSQGLFPALGLARDWLPLCESLGLPPLLPPAWTGRPQP